MVTFSYSALKPDGSVTKGELTAADRADAFRRLGRNGLQPVALEVKSAAATAPGGSNGAKTKAKDAAKTAAARKGGAAADAKAGDGRRRGARSPRSEASGETRGKKKGGETERPAPALGPVRLKRSQIVLFTEELADLLGAGLQLEPALKIMESREELSNLKVVSALVRQQVRDGASFSSALRNASPSFGELYCSLAAAGEVSGALGTILRRQAQYLLKIQDLQNKVVVALIYPACLFIAVVAVSFLFVSFLMPQLVSLLESTRGKLPTPAVVMLAVSGFLKSYWWVIVLIVIGAVTLFRKIVSKPPYEEKWHHAKLKLPLVGPVLQRRFFVQLLETLSNLVGNGLPLLKGLELTRNATMNLFGRNLMDQLIDAVGEGASLSRTMRRVGFFPPLLIDMIAVGEQTGDLTTALNRAAERYDKELEKGIERLTAMMQPVILMILASIVGPMAYMMIRVILESITSMQG